MVYENLLLQNLINYELQIFLLHELCSFSSSFSPHTFYCHTNKPEVLPKNKKTGRESKLISKRLPTLMFDWLIPLIITMSQVVVEKRTQEKK